MSDPLTWWVDAVFWGKVHQSLGQKADSSGDFLLYKLLEAVTTSPP